jgi:drug/metabolite transporter (DMT)-like permease
MPEPEPRPTAAVAGTSGAAPVDGTGDSGIPQLPAPVVAGGIGIGVLAVSTAAILIRLADAHPLALSFWRCALGALVLAPFALRSRRGSAPLDGGQRRQLLGSGLFLAVHFALFISALDFTTVASASVLVAMSPLFVGLGAALFLREPPSRRTWIGIAIAGAGAVVVGVADAAGGTAEQPLLGDLLAFGGAASVAGYLLVGRAARRRLPVTVYAAAVYGVAAAVLLPVCLLGGVELWGYDTGTWLAIIGLVAGPQLLGHTVFNTLLSTVTATVVAVTVLAEPVGATILAAVLLGELPASGFWAGAPLILAGVFLAAARPRRG